MTTQYSNENQAMENQDDSVQEMNTSFQMSYLQMIKKDSFKDRAFGCILSSFIGDAAGAYLEF